jgi:hypothetical protein
MAGNFGHKPIHPQIIAVKCSRKPSMSIEHGQARTLWLGYYGDSTRGMYPVSVDPLRLASVQRSSRPCVYCWLQRAQIVTGSEKRVGSMECSSSLGR